MCGVYETVSAIRRLAEEVRWRWFLPIGMVGITFALVTDTVVKYLGLDSPIRRYDMPGDMEPFSLLLAKALNGPAFPSFLIRGGHVETVLGKLTWIPVVFGFWFVVGLALESKLKHPRQWLIRRPRTRVIVFLFLLSICGWLLYREVWLLRFVYRPSEMRLLFPRLRWWTPGLSIIPQSIWCLIGIAYFSTKLWNTLASRQQLTTIDQRLTDQ